MSAEVSLHLFGDEVFRHRLQNIADRTDNMSPAHEKIRDKWIIWFEEQFATEGRRFGTPWEQLKLETAAKRGSAHPILVDSADLLIHVTDPESFQVDDDGISFKPSEPVDEYGKFHQSGTTRMARRPIVEFTEMDHREMVDDLEDHIFNPEWVGFL